MLVLVSIVQTAAYLVIPDEISCLYHFVKREFPSDFPPIRIEYTAFRRKELALSVGIILSAIAEGFLVGKL